jgi:hypothetical protein
MSDPGGAKRNGMKLLNTYKSFAVLPPSIQNGLMVGVLSLKPPRTTQRDKGLIIFRVCIWKWRTLYMKDEKKKYKYCLWKCIIFNTPIGSKYAQNSFCISHGYRYAANSCTLLKSYEPNWGIHPSGDHLHPYVFTHDGEPARRKR